MSINHATHSNPYSLSRQTSVCFIVVVVVVLLTVIFVGGYARLRPERMKGVPRPTYLFCRVYWWKQTIVDLKSSKKGGGVKRN